MMLLVSAVFCVSCSDDEPKTVSIVGKWESVESYSDDGILETIRMNLTFNSDRTGSIVETWNYETRATSTENYSMNFSWATTTDSNGNDILKISYISGDKVTELFPGSSAVLWTRQYVLTGDILNIHDGDGVWVFKRK